VRLLGVLAVLIALIMGGLALSHDTNNSPLRSHPTGDAGTPPHACPATDTFQAGSAWVCGFPPYNMVGQQPPCYRAPDPDGAARFEDRESPRRRHREFKFHNTHSMVCPGERIG
jgi:hypothetical protein